MFHNLSNSKFDITNDHDQVHDFFGGKFLPFCKKKFGQKNIPSQIPYSLGKKIKNCHNCLQCGKDA
jgi:hypothetical protein